MGTRRKTKRKGLAKTRTSYGVQNNTYLQITDNSGAKVAQVIMVDGYKNRLRRLPKATVGSMVTVTVKKGRPDLKGNIMKAVVVRQKQIFKRVDGTRLCFEDNAAVMMKADEPIASEIRGPIAREAAEEYPRLASISSLII